MVFSDDDDPNSRDTIVPFELNFDLLGAIKQGVSSRFGHSPEITGERLG